jgi:hypothetical protein
MDAQDRYVDLLMEKVRGDRYPSGEMLDRIEYALQTRSQAEAYLELLHEKVDDDRFPSGEMLNRIERNMKRVSG